MCLLPDMNAMMVKFDVMRKIHIWHACQVNHVKLQYFMYAGLSLLGPSDVKHYMCHHVCSADFRGLLWVSSVLCLFMLSHLVPSIKPRHEKVCQTAILNALRTTLKSVPR